MIRGMAAALGSPGFLPVLDARRPRIGRAILGALVITGLFEIFAFAAKEFSPVGDHAPWMDDPYDVVTSFALFFIPIVGGVSAVRLVLCRRWEPLPLDRLTGLAHGCVVLLVIASAVAASDWIAVLRGTDRASWTSATPILVAGLGVMTVGLALAAGRLGIEIRRLSASDRGDPRGPDWLADATTLALRLARRLGRIEPGATHVIVLVDRGPSAWVRRHAIAATALAASGVAALFGLASLREGDGVSLLVFVLVVAWSGTFAFLLAVGPYLGLVRSTGVMTGARRRLLDALVIGCASVPITVAFRDGLWALVGSSAAQAGLGELDRLVLLVLSSVVGAVFAFETLTRAHRGAAPEEPRPGRPGARR
jgi:hypothetical protein